MCGHVGWIAGKPNLALAKRLLVECQVRGRDATGYLEINGEDGSYTLRKMAIKAVEFVLNMKFQFKKAANHTFLGHTRLATTGDKTDTLQAHPFIGNRFILFHNGTVSDFDQKRLSKKFEVDSPHGVDSELFLSYLEKHGVNALRDTFLPELSQNSSYALVIFDKVTKTIHFMTCNGRSLYLYKTPENGLFYASTVEILQAALGKRQLKPELLQPYTHVEISLNSGDILQKCAIRAAKASLDYSDAASYIQKYRKPIRFF